jgi:hypothetical protein
MSLVGLHGSTDGPDEAQELAADRRHHLLLALAAAEQPAAPRVQPVLRLPSDRRHPSGLSVAWRAERPADGRAMAIGPGRFNDDPAKMGIPGLGDPPAAQAARGFSFPCAPRPPPVLPVPHLGVLICATSDCRGCIRVINRRDSRLDRHRCYCSSIETQNEPG